MSFDFFAAQERARIKSLQLLVVFFLLTIVFSYLTSYSIFFVLDVSLDRLLMGSLKALPSEAVGFLALIIFLFLVTGAWTMDRRLRGDRLESFLLECGAQRVMPDTKDLHERMFRNVSTEMAVASGLPLPALFVIRNERSINAFTAGYTPDTASIVVTEGALHCLTRSELQGVIGHEFSHILSGDVRTKMDLMSILHGYSSVSSLGRELMSSRHERLLGFSLFICGSLGRTISLLVKALHSRQREWLADASSVQFTRNPNGLRGALEKIDLNINKKITTLRFSDEFSHMFFVSGLGGFLAQLLASHPPIQDRIRALGNPNYKSPPNKQQINISPLGQSESIALTDEIRQDRGEPAAKPTDTPVVHQRYVLTNDIGSRTGKIPAQALENSNQLLESLPKTLKSACESALKAEAVAIALLCYQSSGSKEDTIHALRTKKTYSHTFLDFIRDELFPLIRTLNLTQAMLLLELTCETLKSFDEKKRYELIRNAHSIITADESISLTEICMMVLFGSRILTVEDLRGIGRTEQSNQATDILCLIAYTAHIGARTNNSAAQEAYSRAVAELGLKGQTILPEREIKTSNLLRAVGHIRATSDKQRQRLIDALTKCIASDGRVFESELQILRAVCSSLGCPMPLIRPRDF